MRGRLRDGLDGRRGRDHRRPAASRSARTTSSGPRSRPIGRIDLWRVAVQPGKPFAFGTRRAGRRRARSCCSGCPATRSRRAVTFELFVRPAHPRGSPGRRDLLRAGRSGGPRRAGHQEPRPARRSCGSRPSATTTARRSATAAAASASASRAGRGATSSRPSPRPTPSRSSRRPTTRSRPAPRSRSGGSTGHDGARPLIAARRGGPDGIARPQPRAERRRLSHVDRAGRPRMVDVSAKPVTARRAVAEATVAVSPETMSLVIDGGGTKGDVLGVAELAGVMGGKRTSDLIPLCHPLALTDLRRGDHAGPCRGRAAHPRRGRDDRPDRRRDGGDDRRVGRGPDRLRHGQGRGARRRDPGRPAASARPAARAASGSATAGADAAPGAASRGDRSAARVARARTAGRSVTASRGAEPAAARRMRRRSSSPPATGPRPASARTRPARRRGAADGPRLHGGARPRRRTTRGDRGRARRRRRGPRPDRHDRRHRPHAARRDAAGDPRPSSTTRSPGSPRRCAPRAGRSRRSPTCRAASSGCVGRTLVVNVPGSPKGAIESFAAVEPVLDHALETLAGPVSTTATRRG